MSAKTGKVIGHDPLWGTVIVQCAPNDCYVFVPAPGTEEPKVGHEIQWSPMQQSRIALKNISSGADLPAITWAAGCNQSEAKAFLGVRPP